MVLKSPPCIISDHQFEFHSTRSRGCTGEPSKQGGYYAIDSRKGTRISALHETRQQLRAWQTYQTQALAHQNQHITLSKLASSARPAEHGSGRRKQNQKGRPSPKMDMKITKQESKGTQGSRCGILCPRHQRQLQQRTKVHKGPERCLSRHKTKAQHEGKEQGSLEEDERREGTGGNGVAY